jgi:hypothetical protein
MVAVVVGNVIVVESVPESVRVFVTASVLAFVSVNVPVVVEMVSPLKLVPVAAPSTGATKVTTVPLLVHPVIPPNAPALLYWHSVLEPPGEPPAALPMSVHVLMVEHL